MFVYLAYARSATRGAALHIAQAARGLVAGMNFIEAYDAVLRREFAAVLRGDANRAAAVKATYLADPRVKSVEQNARVRKSAQEMAALIDHLLQLARVTRSEVTRSRVDLSAIAQRVTERLRALVDH